MADNIAIKDASAASVTMAADDISSVFYPRHKLSLGADGSAVDAVAGAGAVGTGVQRVTLASDDPAVTSLARLGKLDLIQVTLSLDTSAYAAGDLVADAQAVANAGLANAGKLRLRSITVIDQDDQKANLDIYLCNLATSWGSENSAPTISDAVALGIQGVVSIAVADYKDLGGVSIAHKNTLDIPLECDTATTSLYVAVVAGATTTPTYTASGVKITFGFEQHT
ncbi:MAG TPA: hypothetical protein VEI97_08380 [bacterium]|nr:hypothetical protein [bacterium]